MADLRTMPLPKFPLGHWVETAIDTLKSTFAGFTNEVSDRVKDIVGGINDFLLFFPPPLVIVVFAVLAWLFTRRKGIVAFTLVGLTFIWNLGYWAATMQTLSLVIVATAIAIAMGIPLGIFAAISRTFHRILMPILDFMQTLPAFVYLIPAIPFFGLGATSAIFSTVIFAMPPAIRLTDLGIRQVPADLVECADAFGSTTAQKLFKLQLPLAAASIRAGVNQTILLSLSMVVIAAMIGAPGLGSEVWKAIQRNQPGMGFESGVCIVILAIVLDRIMQSAGGREESGSTT